MDGSCLSVGTWVQLVSIGTLRGVVVKEAGKGMLMITLVVAESLLAPVSIEELEVAPS